MSDPVPLSEIVLDELDAHAGLDHLADCVGVLERAFADWQASGADQFPLLVAAASPTSAIVLHASHWPDDVDDVCAPELARAAVLASIEGERTPKSTDVIVAGLSLLLGRDGRARQRKDADLIQKSGGVALCIALLASAGDEVEVLLTTVSIAPRVLH